MLVPLKEEDRCNTLDLSRGALSRLKRNVKKYDCGLQLKTIHVIVGVKRGVAPPNSFE